MLLGGAAMFVLPSCGGSAGGAVQAPSAPAAIATAAPAAAAVPPASPQPAAQPANGTSNDLLAKGKVVFEQTAGGVGCAYCHGLDGKGQGPSGLNAPANRGAPEAKVRNALSGAIPMMAFIKLTDDEIDAVVAYVQYLGTQP